MKTKGMGKLALWTDHIVNHFWYCCESCNDSVENLKVYCNVAAVNTHLLISLNRQIGSVYYIMYVIYMNGPQENASMNCSQGHQKTGMERLFLTLTLLKKTFLSCKKLCWMKKWLKSLQHYTSPHVCVNNHY